MTRSPEARLAAFAAYGRGSRHAYLSLPVLADVRAAVAGAQYDLVHAERLYVADAAMAVDTPRRTLDLDEDDAWSWRQAAPDADRAWHEAEARAEDRLLERIGPHVDRLFVSGAADRQTLISRHPGLDTTVVPNAVSLPVTADRDDDSRTLLFVGSFGYAPNVEGICWFVSEVLPLIPAHLPLRVCLVGRGVTDEIRALGNDPRIEIVGAVEDLAPFYRSAALAIAPLRTGGGTRLKVIEALAYGVPVVASSLALRGIAVDDTMVWRADDGPAFAAAIVAALADAKARATHGLAGRHFAAEQHDRDRIVAGLADRFAGLLERAR
jgi:glycosyltransferase involved in cell wall biosynthesis